LYDKFSEVAQIVDPLVAYTLAFEALHSLSPAAALLEILETVQQRLIHGESLDNLDTVQSMCTQIIVDSWSPGDLADLEAIFKEASEFTDPEILPLWQELPSEPFYFTFGDKGLRFAVKALQQVKLFGLLWLESIRQQLATGIGLRCPFWWPDAWPQGECCNNKYRLWLEGIWNYTQGSSQTWQPQGCLKSSPAL
jgi:hypothetical protein